MAKSYFGKYEDQWEAQRALDEGTLLNPFVAVWEDTVHYNDLEPVEPGEVEPKSFTDVSWSGDTIDVSITAPNNRHWEIKDYDTDALTIPQFSGWGDGTPTITVNENDTVSSRDLSFSVYFDYPDSTAHTRNIETVTIQQNAPSVQPGYVTDGANPVTSLTATYNKGTVGYLYGQTDGDKRLFWVATSDADWFFFGNTSSAWTDSGDPTEIYAYQNPYDSARTTNITFRFYLDDQMQNLYNTVVIPFTQEGHVIQPGYVDPSLIELESTSGQEYQFMVYGQDLYWRLGARSGWIVDYNWGTEGEGIQQKSIRVNTNHAADRTGSFQVDFYVDSEKTILKNSFIVTVTQPGENKRVASWKPDYEETNLTVGYSAGTCNLYVLNNPNNEYVRTQDYYGNIMTGDPQTTAFTISYPENYGFDDKGTSFVVSFSPDPGFSYEDGSAWVNLWQNGNPDAPHAFVEDRDVVVPASGGTRTVDIVLSHAVKWELESRNGETFPDYPGETTISGDSSVTAVTVNIAQNTSYWDSDKSFWAKFYDQDDQKIGDDQQVIYTQRGYHPVTATFMNGEEHVYLPGSYTGDVVVHIAVESGYYYKVETTEGATVASGGVTTDITATTISQPNTSGDMSGMAWHMLVYDDSEYTHQVYDIWLGYDQFSEPVSDPYIDFVEHFNVSTSGETFNVNGTDYFDGYSSLVLYDNLYCVELEDGENGRQFTFPQAGNHTLTYRRVNYNLQIQDWCQQTEANSVEVYAYNTEGVVDEGYKFYGDDNGYSFLDCSAMTAVTFDEHLVDMGGNGGVNTTFSGCTSLVSISCYNATEPTINTTSFETITANTGTLHIPSGSTYSNWAAALGSNWTVVDDL